MITMIEDCQSVGNIINNLTYQMYPKAHFNLRKQNFE